MQPREVLEDLLCGRSQPIRAKRVNAVPPELLPQILSLAVEDIVTQRKFVSDANTLLAAADLDKLWSTCDASITMDDLALIGSADKTVSEQCRSAQATPDSQIQLSSGENSPQVNYEGMLDQMAYSINMLIL